MIPMPWKIWVDTGGTFTDCIAVDPQGQTRYLKILSSGILRVRITRILGNKITIDLPLVFVSNFVNGFSIKVGSEIRTIVDFSVPQNEATVDNHFQHIPQDRIAEIYSGEEVPVLQHDSSRKLQ